MKRAGIIMAVIVVIAAGAAYFVIARHSVWPSAAKEIPELFPVCDRCGTSDRKWGYIDPSGKLAIGFQFEEVKEFQQGLAAAKTGRKWGFIGEDGRFVINPQFDDAGTFAEGLAPISLGDKWGYVDKRGEYAINLQFDGAGSFSEGLAPVSEGHSWTFIDHKGESPKNLSVYHVVWRFTEGFARVENFNNTKCYITHDGNWAIKIPFRDAGNFSEGLAWFAVGDKYGYIHKNGKYAINPQFDDAQDFSEGLAAAKSGGKWGYIDKSGKIVINPQFDNAEGFSEGLAAVKIGDKWGYIDKSGKIVIDPQFYAGLFMAPGPFQRGLAKIYDHLYVNTKSEWIWPNAEKHNRDWAQLLPVFEADRAASGSGGDIVDGDWLFCVDDRVSRAVCFQTAKNSKAAILGQSIFQDKRAAEKAEELHFDAVIFQGSDGKVQFAMRPTVNGWVPVPGMPRPHFMHEATPSSSKASSRD